MYLTKPQVAAGSAVVAPVKVTSGTLGNVVLRQNEDVIDTNINTGALEILETMTIAEFSAAILDNNNGILEGDQFSLIQYIQQTDPQGFPFVICRPYEIILNRTDGRPLEDFIPYGLLAGGSAQDPILSVDASAFTGGVAIVLSRTTASNTRVTTSYICLTPGNSVYPQFTSQAAADAARESYGQNEDAFLESRVAADTTGNVTVTTSLLSISVNGTELAQMAEVSIPIAANTPIVFGFSQPITVEAADLRLLAGGRNSSIAAVATATPVISGNTVRFAPTAAIGTSEWTTGSSFNLGVEMAGIKYVWTLKVSSNSMD